MLPDISQSSHKLHRVAGPQKHRYGCRNCSCLQAEIYTIRYLPPVEGHNIRFMTYPDVVQRFNLSSRVAGTRKHGSIAVGISLLSYRQAGIYVSVFVLPVSGDL